MRPGVGFNAHIPQNYAGILRLPPISDPNPNGEHFARN